MPVIDTVEAAQQRMIHWLADVSQGTYAFPVLVRRPAHAYRLCSNRDGLAGLPDPAELQLPTHPRTSLIGPFRAGGCASQGNEVGPIPAGSGG